MLGVLLGVYLLWQVTAYPVGAHEEARCIDYTTHTPNDALIGLLYITATCGPALISSRRYLRWFGMVSLVGVIVTAVVRVDELTSLWCVYVAIVSVLILEHFRRQRASEVRAISDPAPSAWPTVAPLAVRDLSRGVCGLLGPYLRRSPPWRDGAVHDRRADHRRGAGGCGRRGGFGVDASHRRVAASCAGTARAPPSSPCTGCSGFGCG